MGLIQHTGQLPQVGLQRSNRLTHFCQLYVAPGRHNPDVERAERPLRQELNQSVRLQGSRQVHAADQRHAQAFLAHLLDKNLVVAGAMQLHFKKKQSNGFASFLIADSAYSASATARFYLKFRPLVRWCGSGGQRRQGATNVLQNNRSVVAGPPAKSFDAIADKVLGCLDTDLRVQDQNSAHRDGAAPPLSVQRRKTPFASM